MPGSRPHDSNGFTAAWEAPSSAKFRTRFVPHWPQPTTAMWRISENSWWQVAGRGTFPIRTPSPPPHGLYRVYGILYGVAVEHRISATDLARKLGDVLGRVYRGDSFVVERNGDPIARLVPLPGKAPSSLREALAAWHAAGARDLTFADDLERIGAADSPPENPWAS